METLDEAAITAGGVGIVRRRSGGGAVFVAPDAQIWLDLYVPTSDPLFSADVTKAATFVGELWRSALLDLLGADARIESYSGPLVQSRWSRVWCYSGLGPGEVSRDQKKLVGLSQRRNRDGAWFFTMALTRLDPDRDASFIAAEPKERAALAAELRSSLTTLDVDHDVVIARLKAGLAEL